MSFSGDVAKTDQEGAPEETGYLIKQATESMQFVENATEEELFEKYFSPDSARALDLTSRSRRAPATGIALLRFVENPPPKLMVLKFG